MKCANFCELYDDSKYQELISLYNAWNKRTCFLSVGNTTVGEWYKLLKYCLEHKKETVEFYLDLIEVYNQEIKEGKRSNDFVGFFNDIIFECFKDDDKFPKFNGFVGGDFCQNMYKEYAKWYLEGKPKRNWWNKILHKGIG